MEKNMTHTKDIDEFKTEMKIQNLLRYQLDCESDFKWFSWYNLEKGLDDFHEN